MAYVYLLDLYKYIEERIGEAAEELDEAENDAPAAQFEQGRINALTEFQNFLRDNFNPKLPRRIRESLTNKESP